MRFRKTLLNSALLATVLNFAVPAAHAVDLLDSVKNAGVLRVGMEGTYPPFNFRNEAGQLDGYDVAVAKAVADKLGVKVQFITTEWAGIIAGLQAGKYDVIVSQVTITPQRKEAFDFSQPYVYSTAQLIQRADDKRDFRSLDDLKGKKVGVGLGTVFADMAKSAPGIDIMTYPGTPEFLNDLASGRIDATIDDQVLAPYLIKTSHLPLRTGAVLKGVNLEAGIPFRKGDPKFAKAVDDALTSMKQDGTLKKLSIKWFGIDASHSSTQ